MKYVCTIIVCALLSPLVQANFLRKTRTQDSVETLSSDNETVRAILSSGIDTGRICDEAINQEVCASLGSCGWINGGCKFKIVEGCGMMVEGNACESIENCIWRPKSDDANARPGENMICANKNDLIDSIVDPAPVDRLPIEDPNPIDLLPIEPNPEMRICQEANNQEVCDSLGSCGWFDGRCAFKIVEGCGFLGDKDMCTRSSDCVWMSDENDSRPNAQNNRCMDKTVVVANGNCALEGLVIRSRTACNSIKGCSWNTQDKFSESCTVAPTQLQCANIKGRRNCRQAGCVRNNKTCVGSWEMEFLSALKREKGPVAKSKIEEEYGEETYEVVFVQKGDSEPKAQIKNDKRIKLFLGKRGRVKKGKFG